MTIQSRFDTISPIDSRFYGGDAALYKSLHPYLSAAAVFRYQARVEGALAQAMADAGICDRATADAIARAADRILPQEVAEEETKMPGIAEYHAGGAHQTYRMLDDFIQDAFARRL